MENQSINVIVGNNIAKYRKQEGLTQLEFAQKLNYSDKAVSKWERGESIPDVSVLLQIANMFGITINDLCYETKVKSKEVIPQNKKITHTYVTLLSFGLCWLVATIVFACLLAFAPELERRWLAFIYAIPVSSVVLIVFNSLYGKRAFNAIFVSMLIWGILLSICLTANSPSINWLYIIGIPLEILTVIWYFFKAKIIEKITSHKKQKQNSHDDKTAKNKIDDEKDSTKNG